MRPGGIEPASFVAVGRLMSSVTSAPMIPAPCIRTSQRLNPARSPACPVIRNVSINPDSTVSSAPGPISTFWIAACARADHAEALAAFPLGRMPATIEAIAPPIHSVNPRMCRKSQA